MTCPNCGMESEHEMTLEQENESLSRALIGMVLQHCEEQKPGEFFSGFLSYDAAALRLLCELGLMELIEDAGPRAVYARIKK